jgi:hypothetical protein
MLNNKPNMLILGRNKIKLSSALLISSLCIFFGLIVSGATFAACTNVPISGEYSLESSCTFSGTVDGVEEGNIIVAENATLTVNAGQTLVWNPGYSVVINGTIAINKSGGANKEDLSLVY